MLRAVVVPVAVLVGLTTGAAPAFAHGGGGAITLVNAESTGTDAFAVEVCVTFTLDRDQANTARVTMKADGPGQATVAPQKMEVGDQPGLRTGEIHLPSPGSWTITVESTFPPGQLAIPVSMGSDERPTPAATASTNPLAATCTPESSSLPTWLVAGLGTAAAVIVFGGVLLLLRRSTTPAEA